MSVKRSGLCVSTTVAVLTSLWLAGCGPHSAVGLRDASHKIYSFEVAADYAAVHERIIQRARRQYVFAGPPRRQPGVTARLSPESRSAAVTLWDSGGIGIRYRLSAEIREIDPARARVDLYAAGKSDRKEARLWAAWANTPLPD